MKIVADENIPLVHEFFGSLGRVECRPARALTPRCLRDADALMVRSVVPVGAHLLEGTPVQYVGSCTAGTDHLDWAYLARRGIHCRAAPGCNAASVVEYVLAGLAALDALPSPDTVVGIIGCGNVGGALYRRLRGLGVPCRCYDPFLTPQRQPDLMTLEQILEADVVCVHAPLSKTGPFPSDHLLGEAELRRLPPEACLISAGRGAVVDNRALLRVMESRPDLQTVLDVWESEPCIDRALFAQVDLGTPHIAGYSYDGKARGTEMVYRDFCDFFGLPRERRFAELDQFPVRWPLRPRGREPGEALRDTILQAYDPREDHARLDLALKGAAEPGEAFDRLRKHYPVRREFSNYAVSLAAGQRELGARLAALGFRPQYA